MPVTRPLTADDAPALTELLVANREFLAPWQPLRPDAWYTEPGQRQAVVMSLEQQAAGLAVPLVVQDGGGAVVGAITPPSPSSRSTASRRWLRLPTARTERSSPSSTSDMPAESYPRYSSFSRPDRRISWTGRLPT